jgi:hypothetical protein
MEIKSASGSEPTAAPQSGARRRLVRGAFALPAALTVATGSVAANSNMRCLANTVANPTYPAPTTDLTAKPQYQRIQLAALVHNGDNGNGQSHPTRYFVRGASIPSELRSVGYMSPSSTEWQAFDFTNNTDVGGAIFTSQPSDGGFTYQQNSGQYAVLRFNASGDVVGVGRPAVVANGESAITQSCWHSFG